MTYQRDFDDLLREWADLGDERLPDRFLEAALREIETTEQRGAWPVPLEGFLMRVQYAAPILGVAAVAIAAFAVYFTFFGPAAGEPGPSPSPSASARPATPSPVAAVFTVADLDAIVLGKSDAPLDSTFQGHDPVPPLLLPVWYLSEAESQRFINLPRYVDGTDARFGLGPYLFVSAVLVFEDADAASGALAAYREEIQSGWGLTDPTPTNPNLGDESLLFSGPAERQEGEPGAYYFWRVENLLLEAVGVGAVEGDALTNMEAAVREMADEMERRGQGLAQSRSH